MSDSGWGAFCSRCRDELDLDPETEADVTAGERLGGGEGPWIKVWNRFEEAPASYPGVADLLGRSGHNKDVQLWDRHTIHLDTVVTGSGAIDHARYIARLESLGPEIYLIVEACETSQASEVHRFLTDQASRAGVRVY